MTPVELASLERRVRWLDRLFRWGLSELPTTAIGRPLLVKLIRAYEAGDDDTRRRLRALMARCHAFADNVGLETPANSPDAFREQLVRFCLTHESGDPRDILMSLHYLVEEAAAAGIEVIPLLGQAADIAGDEGEGQWSARAQLLGHAEKSNLANRRRAGH